MSKQTNAISVRTIGIDTGKNSLLVADGGPARLVAATLAASGYLAVVGCPYRKSNPDIVMMQSSEERPGNDASNPLDWPRNRCILI
jgi:hypothetical protein